MQQRRRVLVFAVLADDRRLAIGLRGRAERLGRLLRQYGSQLLAGVDQLGQVVDKAPGEGVLEYDHRRGLAHRALGLTPAVAEDLFDDGHDLPDFHHVSLRLDETPNRRAVWDKSAWTSAARLRRRARRPVAPRASSARSETLPDSFRRARDARPPPAPPCSRRGFWHRASRP